MSTSEYAPELLTLPSNLTPSLAVEVLPHGLTLHRLYVQADGKTHDILLGPESPSDHAHRKYTNSIIGRYTNRLPAEIPLSLPNGKTFTVPHNESPKVSLHGGPTGFDYLPWTPLAPSDATLFTTAEIDHLKDDNALTSRLWTLTSSDGDQGYPGTLRVEALVALVPPSGNSADTQSLGSIVLAYRAKLIDAAADDVTPVNLTQHWGFNLSASANPSVPSTIKDHTMRMAASHYLAIDSDLLPTGKAEPLTPAHILDGSKIGDGEVPEGGYDHFYIFSPRPSVPAYHVTRLSSADSDIIGSIIKNETLEPSEASVIDLASSESGISLKFFTNQSGVQFYSNNFADGSGSRKSIHGGGEGLPGYGKFSAAFLEFHEPIASFLYPELQQRGESTILRAGEVYSNWVRLEIGKL